MTLGLAIDDKVLKAIIRDLYYPDSPYEFSVLPTEILGHVYEQFLGKVIRLTPGHRAVVEDKPDVKKAGGVYYTPTYIVDYIVEHTVGKLLGGECPDFREAKMGLSPSVERKSPITPTKAAKLRVVDPACGSGSFLLGAYQYLLNWHRDWYEAHDAEKHARGRNPKLYRGPGGDWRLTTAERKRILLNNIYGVDIDPQAVEVTKLSLLLKVLEGESDETLSNQLRLFHERALPDLADNIKCGNSLIGPDFYEGQQMSLLDEEEVYRINAFDWEAEFPQVFEGKNSGFDAVIGNPPYIRMEEFKEIKWYLRENYAVHGSRSDMYAYFVEIAHRLVRLGGLFGMILSNKFIKANYGMPLRRFLHSFASVEELTDFAGLRVFHGATVRPVVLLTRKTREEREKAHATTRYLPPMDEDTFEQVKCASLTLGHVAKERSVTLAPASLLPEQWILVGHKQQSVIQKLKEVGTPLGSLVGGRVLWGIKTGLNAAFVIDGPTRARMVGDDPANADVIEPFLFGEDVRRYTTDFKDRYLIYTYHRIDISAYPDIEAHLRPFKSRLQRRATKQAWYELQQPSVALVPVFRQPKILYPEIARACQFTLDTSRYFSNNKTFILPTSDLYVLGVLNSTTAFFYFTVFCAALESARDRYLEFRAQYVRDFPVRTVRASDAKGKQRREGIVELVARMIDFQERLRSAGTAHEKTLLQRQIDATDREIDRLVYELYELTDEEIQIVEEATGS